MLYDIGGVSNEARNQHIAGRQFNVAPQLLFMFVAGVGSLKTVCTNSDTQHQIHNIFKRNVKHVGPFQLPQQI
jgi:hypothetical protein